MTHKVVFNARNSAEANAVHQWLAQAGIESSVQNDELQGGAFDLGNDPDPQVVVAEADFQSAREIVIQFEEELNRTVGMSELSDEEGQFDWPACPICDELRHSRCQQCGYTGSEFAPHPSDESQLVCQACEQPTPASLQNNCAFCNHDFNTSDDADTRVTADMGGADVNRVALVIGGLIALFVIFIAWLLFR